MGAATFGHLKVNWLSNFIRCRILFGKITLKSLLGLVGAVTKLSFGAPKSTPHCGKHCWNLTSPGYLVGYGEPLKGQDALIGPQEFLAV